MSILVPFYSVRGISSFDVDQWKIFVQSRSPVKVFPPTFKAKRAIRGKWDGWRLFSDGIIDLRFPSDLRIYLLETIAGLWYKTLFEYG